MGRADNMRDLTENMLLAQGRRVEEVANVREETSRELSGFHAAHAEMAAEQREGLAEAHARLASDTQTFLGETHRATRAMADEQREHLREDRARLASDTDDLRKRRAESRSELASETEAMLGTLHEETAETAAVWQEAARALRRGHSGDRPANMSPAPTSSGDLTAIRGIGTGTRDRLRAGGIHSFSQLARASRDRVAEIIGPTSAARAKIEDWIAQARQLAAGD